MANLKKSLLVLGLPRCEVIDIPARAGTLSILGRAHNLRRRRRRALDGTQLDGITTGAAVLLEGAASGEMRAVLEAVACVKRRRSGSSVRAKHRDRRERRPGPRAINVGCRNGCPQVFALWVPGVRCRTRSLAGVGVAEAVGVGVAARHPLH